ncbi:metal ABC transporter ATP-binding protein [soil metagenome]
MSDFGCPGAHPLVVDGLHVAYGGTPALRGVGFATACGHRLALLGPNGAGKSTLLKTLAGLVRPDAGRVTWRGTVLAGGSAEIAYLPQRSQIDWDFPATVRHVVEMGRYPHIGFWRRFGRVDAAAVDAALVAMGLGDLQHRQISALSGGQQQRTFLARALAQEAHVFLLDEPFAGLDATASAALGAQFRSLAANGHLIIASHHDLESVATHFDQALVLDTDQVSFGAAAGGGTAEAIARIYATP